MKIIKEVEHFTHTDADGDGCAVLGKHIFTHTNVEFCDYHNVDQKVRDFIFKYIDEDGKKTEEICPYELVLITDISVTYETATLLEYFRSILEVDVLLIDHHATSAYLRDFDWANVNPEIDGVKTSGTSEMYRLLVEETPCFDATEKAGMKAFAEQIRLYDTWDWNRLGLTLPRYLHELLMIIGRKEWLDRFANDINPALTEAELYLVETELKRINRFIKGKLKQMIKSELHGYKVGVVYAEQNHSILGNTMCNENPDIDFAIIINVGGAKISFRTVKDIDTGAFAKEYYDGGGHPKASGCEFNESDKERVFKFLMDFSEFRAYHI
jgi:oligoribonuclease NrnB/cAMP/cGMP phosphodiesterase (DHH superfamily)